MNRRRDWFQQQEEEEIEREARVVGEVLHMLLRNKSRNVVGRTLTYLFKQLIEDWNKQDEAEDARKGSA
jgi:hypothetical protein